MLAKSRVDTTSAESELRMANFARDIGLYAHAGRHYKEALALDPSMKAQIEQDQAKNRALAAAWCMSNAQKAAQAGNLPEAEKWLKVILEKAPDEPQAAKARELLDDYYTKNREARDDHIEAADATLLTTDLKRGKQYYDQMVAKNKEGLLASPAGSKAGNAWEAAIKAGDRALVEIDKVAKEQTDPATQELLQKYRKVVDDQMIEVYTNLASAQTTRSSYQQAMGNVNKALASDPNNSSAISMRARVEEAASNSGRIWW
jgi:tetratricopeptide (TPR) repeat protein